jgi:hypothetical protein
MILIILPANREVAPGETFELNVLIDPMGCEYCHSVMIRLDYINIHKYIDIALASTTKKD